MRRDAMTLDLFEVPQPLPALEGTHDFRQVVAGLVCELLEQAAAAGLNRHQVAAEASRLTGKEVSKAMLDNCQGQANFPHCGNSNFPTRLGLLVK